MHVNVSITNKRTHSSARWLLNHKVQSIFPDHCYNGVMVKMIILS